MRVLLQPALALAIIISLMHFNLSTARAAAPKNEVRSSASFQAFDQRAKNGERLNVVFFGASLTWGANSSDPLQTSYRAHVARKMEAQYPRAHFKFWDAAIGGTGSQLGVFRLDRDVLRHRPDLVFLDFSANDNIYEATPETLASYEAIVHRIVEEARCPLVQVLFPFKWNIATGEMAKMKRRDAHLAIARHYNTAVGDAIALVNENVAQHKSTLQELWPLDGAHPGDKGYALFAQAAWQGFQDGVEKGLVCAAPREMLNASTYMTSTRARISGLGALPAGWKIGLVSRTSAYFDFLMSRWLDDVVIATPGSAKLQLRFRGEALLLLGESTLKSGAYRVAIDGKPIEHTPKGGKQPVQEFNAGTFAKVINGNGHHVQIIATGLAPGVEHTLTIEPVLTGEEELRLESVCVAGDQAEVAISAFEEQREADSEKRRRTQGDDRRH